MKLLFIALLANLLISLVAVRQSAGREPTGLEGLEDKDCFPNAKKALNPGGGAGGLFAASLSSTFIFPTTSSAEASGTSGCKPASANNPNNTEQIRYVTTNFDNILQDISKGEGSYFEGLLFLMGCNRDVRDELNEMANSKFEFLYSSIDTNPEVFLDLLKHKINQNSNWSDACSHL